MKLAAIVPPDWDKYQYRSEGYQLTLGPWILDDAEYATHLRNRELGHYLIVDNGAFEGDQLDAASLTTAADAVLADEVVLPDRVGAPGETLRESWSALGKLNARTLMFAPQGATPEAWKNCLHAWCEKWEVSEYNRRYSLCIGVSSCKSASGDYLLGTRVENLEEAAKLKYQIHLLGVGDIQEFFQNELPLARKYDVRGIDTSVPFALGANGKLLTADARKVHLGDPAKYGKLSTKVRRLIFVNVAVLRNIVSFGGDPEWINMQVVRQVASMWLRLYAIGFAPAKDVLEACYFPRGKYVIRLGGQGEFLQPYYTGRELVEGEEVVEL